ncbi:RHS repeat-associated core domain-containing protein [Luteibacter sp. ME-Dv--P-043b]|uniref:RHS repeat-associated core domain-containing protein n=1 Tax=Luteibacter sp. ME-Dv--P-043b TaxID=3040291 RepID=UPI002553E7D2|nr:RHS repeat-associated core domain-containing protein [Luteibacter sp. ME-Dv--P-043b]
MKTNMTHTMDVGNASAMPTSSKRLARVGAARTGRTNWRVRLAAVWLVCTALLVFAGLGHAAETVTYYYTDQQGTVLATADAAGNVLSNTDYRPYGAIARGTPAEAPGYAGHVEDTDSGLVYMQARYYDPSVGRFMSVDPVSTTAGNALRFGRFTYAVNNPVRLVDPNGQQEVDADELDLETRAAMAKLNPPIGPNMAAPSFTPPPTLAPGLVPETFPEHQVAQDLGLEQRSEVGENLPTAEPKAEKTYQVYIKINPTTREVYTGRTSGTRSPDENVARRDANHHMNEKGFGPAILMYSSSNPDAIRGQEQIMIENYGGSQRSGGTSGNAINGISSTNSSLNDYIEAARLEFRE